MLFLSANLTNAASNFLSLGFKGSIDTRVIKDSRSFGFEAFILIKLSILFLEQMTTGDSVVCNMYLDDAGPKVSYNAVDAKELEEHAKSEIIHSGLFPE